MTATIRMTVPRDEGVFIERPCVWCLDATDILADTPFRPDLGAVPLHMLCAAEITNLYANRGSFLPEQRARMERLMLMTGPQT